MLSCSASGSAQRQVQGGAQHRLHSSRSYRRSLDFAHIPMVYSGHRTIVPSDRGCIPAYFGDSAAISGIAAPINAATLLETFGFGGSHRPLPLCLVIVGRFNRCFAFGSALRRLFLLLPLFFLTPRQSPTAAIAACPPVTR